MTSPIAIRGYARRRSYALERARRPGVELAERVKHLREGHHGSVVEAAQPVRALDGARVGGPRRQDHASLGVRKFGVLQNFIRMAEGQARRHQPMDRKSASALGMNMVVHRRASFGCRRQAGRMPTGPVSRRPRHGHIPSRRRGHEDCRRVRLDLGALEDLGSNDLPSRRRSFVSQSFVVQSPAPLDASGALSHVHVSRGGTSSPQGPSAKTDWPRGSPSVRDREGGNHGDISQSIRGAR